MTLHPELVDRAGLSLIGRISTLPYDQAENLLLKLEQFSPEERALLMTLNKHPVISKADVRLGYYYKRRMCFAALWLLGASWGQIGALYEVSRQTVMDGGHKMMEGQTSRFAQKCSYERMSEYNAQFWMADNQGLIPISMTAVDVARFLLTSTETDDAE